MMQLIPVGMLILGIVAGGYACLIIAARYDHLQDMRDLELLRRAMTKTEPTTPPPGIDKGWQ